MMRVEFIGLSSHGGPKARKIVSASYATPLWACRPASLKSFADTGAKIAGSPILTGAGSAADTTATAYPTEELL
jgi:3-hydroxyisobutyrate dehydrogenase-like beta-hydroxyacid dehydrogenase